MERVKLLFALVLVAFGVYVFFFGSAQTADVAFRTREAIGRHETELEFGLIAIVGLLAMIGLRVHPSIYGGEEGDDVEDED